MKVSAYIPCFNNRETLAAALASLRAQTRALDEILIIDDGSTDGCADALADEPGVRVLRHERNLGRGAARATAMEAAQHELVLCCDATGTLDPAFLERALPHFDDPQVAAVCGRITQPPARDALERWRGRWLYRLDQPQAVRHGALLITGGAIVRASAVRAAGGYARRLRHSEDADLGQRLARAGFDLVYDPRLTVTSLARNSLGQVLERYWRWNVGAAEQLGWRDYARQIWFSMKVMAARDLREGDPAAAAISLLSPHDQFWRTRLRRRGAGAGTIAVLHGEWERRSAECARGLYPRNQLWGIDALERAGLPVAPISPPARGLVAAVAKLLTRVTRGRVPDLRADVEILRRHRSAAAVYAAGGGLFLVPLLRGLGLFRPRVMTWAFGPPRASVWWKLRGLELSAPVLRGHDGVLCLTRKTEAALRPRCPQAVVKTIDWGADLALFAAHEPRAGSYFFSTGKTQRDYATLLEACRDTDLPVRIIAPRACVAGREIPPSVRFVEGSDDPPDAAISYAELREWYADAIAVLIPLHDDPDDPCGLTNILEAMAMGRPITKTRSGCLDIDVEALGIGLHVAPGDAQGWRDAMHALHADPARGAAMGARGLELARTHFNAERFGRDVTAFVREVLDR